MYVFRPDTVPVVILAKRELTEAATAWAQGGIVGVLGSDDSIESHVRDTQEAGAGLVDEATARFIAERSAAAVGWLVEQGVPFTPDDTGPLGLHLTREGGHAVRRIAHAADATGNDGPLELSFESPREIIETWQRTMRPYTFGSKKDRAQLCFKPECGIFKRAEIEAKERLHLRSASANKALSA